MEVLARRRYVLEQDTIVEDEPPDGSGPVEPAARSLEFPEEVSAE